MPRARRAIVRPVRAPSWHRAIPAKEQPPMPPARRRILFALLAATWAASTAFGLSCLWTYESTPGRPAHPPRAWPQGARVTLAPDRPTLILLIHPHCPCSRATLGELAALMTDCRDQLAATVLMLRPDGTPAGWAHTDLRDSAAAIPGVNVFADEQGADSRRLGAATSGQALLYAPDGRLLFAGGITASRGHRGENAGRAAITTLVLPNRSAAPAAVPAPAQTPVYGCPLTNDSAPCPPQGTQACPIR
jgi:hypothetical protein